MDVGMNNLEHAFKEDCKDADCEIHVPTVIEERDARLTAFAWFYAGALAYRETVNAANDDDEALRDFKAAIISFARDPDPYLRRELG